MKFMVLWICVILFSIAIISGCSKEDNIKTIENQMTELKENYPDCTQNNNGEFCCHETYEDGKLKERSCRQFGKD